MDGGSGWTLDELTERVRTLLSSGPAATELSGRVREVPDRRAIRWYTTIGLMDRPSGMRGRNALYGPRHLLQLVAIKKLQSTGLSLAQIQGRLVGASDNDLREIASLEDHFVAPAPAPVSGPKDGDSGFTMAANILLASGVTLTLSIIPESKDIDAIRSAAEPLLDTLTELGLAVKERAS